MKYYILTCSRAFELYVWGKEAFGVWIPLKDGEAILTGYAFVPWKNWRDMKEVCPQRHYATLLNDEDFGMPAMVKFKELRRMQEYVDTARLTWTPRVGQLVQVLCHPYKDLLGRIMSLKDEKARILLGNLYVTLPIAFLSDELT